ncbi:MAG: PLP-dependent aminotransferase family protein [Candidatus Melainabacteria bacterium]|nr:PLP-dependent aminotransferase family protein [Candidatus Melainabacteria bacterium]
MELEIFELILDPKSETQLQKQVYLQLRELILNGKLLPGVRLPPSRKLAETIGASRKTVVSAYDQLLAEGYVSSQTGSGTFVSDPSNALSLLRSVSNSTDTPESSGSSSLSSKRGNDRAASKSLRNTGDQTPEQKKLPRELLADRPEEPTEATVEPDSETEPLSLYARRIGGVDLEISQIEHARFQFFNWQPAFDELPLVEWSRIVGKTFRRADVNLVDYAPDPLGHLPLRQTIAERLRRTRGLDCRAEQIVITCGFSQSIDIVARLHSAEGTELLVENPSYRPVRDIFRTYGVSVRSIAVDQGGMRTERLAKLPKHNIKSVYVTPSHQFPTGAVLTLARRLELLKWATDCGAVIIEDDFDSEFRFRGSPIPAMKTLDKEERVIYLSSFTKVFYPSLAIAFMVVPSRLIPIYTRARWLASDQLSIQLQDALAEFISTGMLERHVKRMRSTYALRRKTLLEAIEDHLEGCATTHGDYAGLSTLIRLKCDLDDDQIISRAGERGIVLTSTRTSYTRNAVQGEFILGYGNLNEDEIRKGIMELRLIIKGR